MNKKDGLQYVTIQLFIEMAFFPMNRHHVFHVLLCKNEENLLLVIEQLSVQSPFDASVRNLGKLSKRKDMKSKLKLMLQVNFFVSVIPQYFVTSRYSCIESAKNIQMIKNGN